MIDDGTVAALGGALRVVGDVSGAGTIDRFGAGDTIDLAGIGMATSLGLSGGTLSITAPDGSSSAATCMPGSAGRW